MMVLHIVPAHRRRRNISDLSISDILPVVASIPADAGPQKLSTVVGGRTAGRRLATNLAIQLWEDGQAAANDTASDFGVARKT